MSSAGRSRPKVLIVEPHDQLREALSTSLGDTFDVLPTRTSNGAVLGFNHHRPPAVLIAMNQKDGHGLELCSTLKKLEGGRRSMVVVYGTTQGLAEDVLEGDLKARFGVDRYIPRGATIKKLDDLLREQLRLGWKAMKMDTGVDPRKVSDVRYNNPMTTTEVVSAKKADDPTASGFFKRLLGRD